MRSVLNNFITRVAGLLRNFVEIMLPQCLASISRPEWFWILRLFFKRTFFTKENVEAEVSQNFSKSAVFIYNCSKITSTSSKMPVIQSLKYYQGSWRYILSAFELYGPVNVRASLQRLHLQIAKQCERSASVPKLDVLIKIEYSCFSIIFYTLQQLSYRYSFSQALLSRCCAQIKQQEIHGIVAADTVGSRQHLNIQQKMPAKHGVQKKRSNCVESGTIWADLNPLVVPFCRVEFELFTHN